MSLTKRLGIGLLQVIAATSAGYAAAFATIMLVTGLFQIGLAAAALVGAAVIWVIGRLFEMRGSFNIALWGTAIGAAIGFGILLTGAARSYLWAYPALMLLPALLGTIMYQRNDKSKEAS